MLVEKNYLVMLIKNNEKAIFIAKNKYKKLNINIYFNCKFIYYRVYIFCNKITFYYNKFFSNCNCTFLKYYLTRSKYFFNQIINHFLCPNYVFIILCFFYLQISYSSYFCSILLHKI